MASKNTLDAAIARLDATVRIFDAFYQFDLVVNGNEYDIVYSYFRSVCASDSVAKNFTMFLFRISDALQKPALELLDGIRGTSGVETVSILIYYLNSFKSKTALYGISILPKPNQTVQRNIVI